MDDLRTRQERMQDLIKENRGKIRASDIAIKAFKTDCYKVVQYIDDFEQLKRAVQGHLSKYLEGQEIKNVEIDGDIRKEYDN